MHLLHNGTADISAYTMQLGDLLLASFHVLENAHLPESMMLEPTKDARSFHGWPRESCLEARLYGAWLLAADGRLQPHDGQLSCEGF